MGKKYDIERRELLPNRNFQFRFIWTMLIPVLFFAVVIILTSLFTIWPLIQNDMDNWQDNVAEIKHALIGTYSVATTDTSDVQARKGRLEKEFQLKKLLWSAPTINVEKYIVYSSVILFLDFLLVLFIVSLIAFRISHRLIGPVLRFRRIMQSVADGDLTQKIVFRNKDEMKPLIEEDFNSMVLGLGERISSIKEKTDNLTTIVGDKKSISDEDLAQLKTTLAEIQKEMAVFQYKKA